MSKDDAAAPGRLPRSQTLSPIGTTPSLPRTVTVAGGIHQPAWCRAEIVAAAPVTRPARDNSGHGSKAPVELPAVMRVHVPAQQPEFHVAPSAAVRPVATHVPGSQASAMVSKTNVAASNTEPHVDKGLFRRAASKAFKLVAALAALWFVSVLALIGLFGSVDPPGSALMGIRALSGVNVRQSWVDLDKISPNLVRAVVVSEDGRFCQHWGIDLKEIEAALKRANGKTPRGASTISMQLAKNLFLWPDKSYVRKALEVPLTLAIESWWSKRRILEVYLNIAEWGPGIFGAEAAARAHFKTSAARLDVRQSALLAASLPNPIRRRAGRPSRTTMRLAQRLQTRIRKARGAAACVLKPVRKAQAGRDAKD